MAEIRPEEIIDTSENRPIEEKTPQTQSPQTQPPQPQPPQTQPENTTPPVFEVKATRVKDLTTEERLRLISDAKNGIDNPYFKVQFFKNGNAELQKESNL